MNEIEEPQKTVAILLPQADILEVGPDKWLRLAEQLAARLQHPVAIVPFSDVDDPSRGLEATIQWYASQGGRRFVVMPLGLEAMSLDCLLSVVTWMRASNVALQLHVARAWTVKDWSDIISQAIFERCYRLAAHPDQEKQKCKSRLLLVSTGADPGDAVGLEMASIVYYLKQADEDIDVRYCFLERQRPSLDHEIGRLDADGIYDLGIVAWRMGLMEIENLFRELSSLHATELSAGHFEVAWQWNRSSGEQPVSIEILENTPWLHIVIECYLDALATRSVERYFAIECETTKSIHREQIDLDRLIDGILPTEYQGRTDEIQPQSMGSRSLPSDQFGKVPWDEIWTSFCDLAMAGGPPHRGRLLESVSSEEARMDLEGYERVVQEIRRGIEMVTGLQTAPSDALGWVGVVCDDEKMCTWLMRAVIVENVMVRREGKNLYLPAGPAFRVTKEIKNVITSVAKTVHYWRAHLRQSS